MSARIEKSSVPAHFGLGSGPSLKLAGTVYAIQIGRRGPIKVAHTTRANLEEVIGVQQKEVPWPLRLLVNLPGTALNKHWCFQRLRPFETKAGWFRPKPPVLTLLAKIQTASWEWPDALTSKRRRAPFDQRAEIAFRIVRAAAMPILPGDTVAAQIRRAASNLGYPADSWRITGAWYKDSSAFGEKAWAELNGAAESRGISVAALEELLQ